MKYTIIEKDIHNIRFTYTPTECRFKFPIYNKPNILNDIRVDVPAFMTECGRMLWALDFKQTLRGTLDINENLMYIIAEGYRGNTKKKSCFYTFYMKLDTNEFWIEGV